MANNNFSNSDSYIGYMGKKDKTNLMVARIFSYIFLVFVTILSLFSFYLLIINATRSNAEIGQGFSLLPSGAFINNLRNVLAEERFSMPMGMLHSFIIAGCTAILSTYFSAMTAYGIYAYDFKGKNFAFKLIMILMMIPTQVSALGFIQMVNSVGLYDTYWPLIIPSIATPVTFFYMKQYIDSTLPMEIIEAARVDGSNEFRTFNIISLPILKPAIAVQMIFAFVGSWNNLFLPSMLLEKVKTVPLILSYVRSDMNSQFQDLGKLYMIIFMSIIPVVIVYICLSKFIIKGVTLGSVKG